MADVALRANTRSIFGMSGSKSRIGGTANKVFRMKSY